MARVLSDIFEFCSTEIVSIPEWEAKAVYGEVSDKKSLQIPTSQWHHTLMKHKGYFTWLSYYMVLSCCLFYLRFISIFWTYTCHV